MTTTSMCALQHPEINWMTIPWKSVIYRVERLQRRIAKAVMEQRWGKVKALMYLVTKSFDAKLLAVRRVTTNKGAYTPGIDNVLWMNSFDKINAAKNLKVRGYSPKPLRRVYIPKKNGKKRALSIPCLYDRAMQALFAIALDPVAETLADRNSYGFRLRRSCADAIRQCFKCLARKTSAKWVFEADIKACFDQISHEWILENIPMNKTVLRKWLKAGYIEKQSWFKTVKGTPQGGIISPTIMNMVLDSMETTLEKEFPKWKSPKVNFIRYADDFVITAPNKETITNKIIPLISDFLSQRGLSLSKEKSKISHIDEGFDFLSQNVRKYRGKLLIHPSKDAIKSFKDKIKAIIKNNRGIPAHALIRKLNPVIRGWSNYHKVICSKDTFSRLEYFMFCQLYRWASKEHRSKNRTWVYKRYFLNNNFSDTYSTKNGIMEQRLYKLSAIPIKYHIKIVANANPFLPEYDEYFEKRRKQRKVIASQSKQKTLVLVKKSNSRVTPKRKGLKSA